MHDNWQFAVTLGTIIAGVFYNSSKIDKVIETLHEINETPLGQKPGPTHGNEGPELRRF